MISEILLDFLGIIFFLFLFWKKLKEDYISYQIFNTAFYVIISILLADLLAYKLLPSWWFWIVFIGIIAGLLLGIFRYRLRVFETIEAATISLLPLYGLIFVSDIIKSFNLASLLGVFVILGFIILFFIFDKHYKKFSWYKSGRIGFSGLTILGLFFLIRAIVAASFPFVLSFGGKHDIFLSAIVAFASFLAVFNLAEIKT